MNNQDKVVQATKDVVEKMGFSAQVAWVGAADFHLPIVSVTVNKDSGLLIGKQGDTLECLERLVRLMVIKQLGSGRSRDLPSFVVDVNGYRRAQAETLIRDAREIAKKVVINRRVESMAPMTSYERRLIHSELSKDKKVETQSVGVEPQRRILIKPVSSLDI